MPRPTPDEEALLQREHPPSLQLGRFRGVPLYPVEITRFEFTNTHPTLRFIQFDRCAASSARVIKYASHVGRSLVGFGRSSVPNVAYRCARLGLVLSNLKVAREISGRRPVVGEYR